MKRKVISISINATIRIARDAIRGFTKKYKKESFGFLLGKRDGESFKIMEVVPYKGGEKGRTGFEGDRERISKRGKELAFRRKKTVLGYYHTHPEIRGELSFGISEMDKKSFVNDEVLLEFIAGIKNSENGRYPFIKHNRDGSISLRFNGYLLRFSVYYKTKKGKIRKGKLIIYL